ncbi:MAG TPA: phosphoglycerate kinase [Candidatus Baltobacteraceae bacterium]|jgi:phosphoglycerate kinase|nr:phosphoglycerate kinase [Candidatus Baltobacteraceae bacterium]
MNFRKLQDLDVRGKRVVVREDLNVPMKDGKVADDTRIDAAIPTLRWLIDRGARVVVLSHLGRPDGTFNPAFSLRPVAGALSDRLGRPVAFAPDCIGSVAHDAVAKLADGDVVLLENVRFHPEEERNNPQFARELASLGDMYVNDAFGTAHRAHASTEGIAHFLPSAAGLLMESELSALGGLIESPQKPFVCVIGGAKVKDKVGVFTHLMERVDAFCIGGGMANTFLQARGTDVGRSLRDDDLAPAKSILDLASKRGVALHLPVDAVVSSAFDADADAHTVDIEHVGDAMILDIGPRTAAAYAGVIEKAKTIVFNGPMGVYEKPAYQAGTKTVGEAIARATKNGATSVVGGGDAAAAAHILGFASSMTHVSTGGGATLEFLEGATLPGIAALEATAHA